MLQSEGLVKFGGTDYSSEVVSFQINRTRAIVSGPATFGNKRATKAAGDLNEEIVITALNEVTAAGLGAALWTAVDTDSAEVAFVGKFIDAAISTNNAEYSGTCVVTGVTVGGKINEYNLQTWTFPITAAGISRDTTP
jgi:hypothetical protein